MPRATVNGVELYYEDAASGYPVVFCHEFAGDYRSWEPQVRAFDRLYRCITYCHRGYPPSTVPADPGAYSQELLIEDLHGLVNHLAIDQAASASLAPAPAARIASDSKRTSARRWT